MPEGPGEGIRLGTLLATWDGNRDKPPVRFRLGDPARSSVGDSDGRAVLRSSAAGAPTAGMPIAPATVVVPALAVDALLSLARVAPSAEMVSVAVVPTGTVVALARVALPPVLAPAIVVNPPAACISAP